MTEQQKPATIEGVIFYLKCWIQAHINDGEIAIQTVIVKEEIEKVEKLARSRLAPAQQQPQQAAMVFSKKMWDDLQDAILRKDAVRFCELEKQAAQQAKQEGKR